MYKHTYGWKLRLGGVSDAKIMMCRVILQVMAFCDSKADKSNKG